MITTLVLCCLLSGLLPCPRAGTPAAEDAPVVAAAVAPLALAPLPREQGAELITATYDLNRVWTAPETDRYAMRTLPFRFLRDDIPPVRDEDEQQFPLDALNDLLWNVVAPGEFEYEGRVLDTVGPHTLRVTAPASVQADVRATLDFLAATVQRRARLDIDIWRTTGAGVLPEAASGSAPGSAPSLDDASALAAAEAAGTLLRLAGRHEELQLGRTERRQALNRTQYVSDWNAEIAQQAATAQPLLETLETGTTLLLRVEPQDSEHVTLRVVAQLSDLRAMEHRTDALRATIHTDSESSTDLVGGVLDQPVVAFATLAGSAVLAVGDELITSAQAQSLDGPIGYVVRCRLVSIDPAPAPLLLAGTPARDVRAIDLSPAMWPALSADVPTSRQYFRGGEEFHDLTNWLVFPAIERRGPAETVQAALDVLSASGGDAGDRKPWNLGSVTILGGDPAVTERLQTALASQLPTRRTLSLQLQLVESGRGSPGSTVARATLPLCTGDTGVAVVGCARMLLTGYDVDVAQGASVPDPIVDGCFDGLALRARAAHDGSVALDLLSHRVLHRDRIDLHVPNMMPVDRVDLGVVSLSPRLLPDGNWQSKPDIASGLGGNQLELRWRLVAP